MSQPQANQLKNTEDKYLSILQVDDDPIVLTVSKEILETENNFKIDTAQSTDEAIQKIKINHYDAVVSDYEMPNKDGLAFLAELTQQGIKTPFILFTGKGREEVAVKALNLGAAGYFNKHGYPETVYGELSHGIKNAIQHNLQAQKAIENEKKYHSLFENMLNGFAYCKMIFDKQNKPIDFEYLEVNEAFEKLTGLKREAVIGKKVSEAIPGTEKANPELFEIYGRVALTGKEEKFETYFKPLLMWLSISVYCPEKSYFVAVFENITEAKKAKEALIESERRWATTLSSIGDAVIATDVLGNITFMNRVAEESTGWTKQEAIGKPVKKIFNIINEFTRIEVADPVSKVLLKGMIVGLANHTILVRKDGSEIAIDDSGAPIKNEEGKIIGVVLVFRDISELRQAQKEQENLARFPMENPEPVLRIEQDGKILFANPVSKSLLNQLNIDDNKNDAPIEWRNQVREALLSNQRKEFEEKHKDKTMLFTVTPVASEGYANIYAIDITQRKQMEESLRESEQRWIATLSSIGDAVIATDLDGKITFMNKVAQQLTCWTMAEASRKPITQVFQIINAKTRKTVENPVTKVLEKGTIVGLANHTILLTKNGLEIPIDDAGAPINDKSGKITGIVLIFRDITERKKTEAEIARLASFPAINPNPIFEADFGGVVSYMNAAAQRIFPDLKKQGKNHQLLSNWKQVSVKIRSSQSHRLVRETQIGEHWYSVQLHLVPETQKVRGYITHIDERKKIENKLKTIGSFTRHDITNKLAVITGNLYLAKKRFKDNPELQRFIEQSEAATLSINQILSFSKAYEELGSKKLILTDVHRCVSTAAKMFSDVKGIVIVNECLGVNVLADGMLKTVFYNLIDNSLKYGKNLTCIKIGCSSNSDGSKSIIYEDNGVGIEAKDKENLFERGFGKGTGYGLYLIKKTCEIYGWTVSEIGKPGEGAKFKFNIPAKRKAQTKFSL